MYNQPDNMAGHLNFQENSFNLLPHKNHKTGQYETFAVQNLSLGKGALRVL